MVQPVPALDHQLVLWAQRGELSAFEELYRRHAGRVRSVALRMTARPALADELVQDVFVKAWRKLASFKGRAKFATWLHRLAVNAIVDGMRREKRFSRPADDGRPVLHVYNSGRLDLERAISTLPTKARMVFVLHDIEGYKHAEIGEVMGINAGTSRAQLHRARRLLREVLR
jgi:RNA polymerase sigma-70 factor, ECF subfamily